MFEEKCVRGETSQRGGGGGRGRALLVAGPRSIERVIAGLHLNTGAASAANSKLNMEIETRSYRVAKTFRRYL